MRSHMAAPALHAAVVAAALLLFPCLLAPVAAQAKAKAFCISQFAIASQACSILPPSPPDEHDDDNEDDDDDDHDDDDEHGGGEGDRHRVRGRHGHTSAAVSVADLVSNNGAALVASNGSHGAGGNVTGGHHGNRTRGGHGRRRRRRRGLGRGRRGRLRDDADGDDDNADEGGNSDDEDHGGDDDEHDDDDHDDEHDDDDDEHDDDDDDDHHEHHDEELRAYRDCCRWLQEVQKECVCEALMRLPPFLVKPQHTYVVRVGRTCRITYRCGGV